MKLLFSDLVVFGFFLGLSSRVDAVITTYSLTCKNGDAVVREIPDDESVPFSTCQVSDICSDCVGKEMRWTNQILVQISEGDVVISPGHTTHLTGSLKELTRTKLTLGMKWQVRTVGGVIVQSDRTQVCVGYFKDETKTHGHSENSALKSKVCTTDGITFVTQQLEKANVNRAILSGLQWLLITVLSASISSLVSIIVLAWWKSCCFDVHKAFAETRKIPKGRYFVKVNGKKVMLNVAGEVTDYELRVITRELKICIVGYVKVGPERVEVDRATEMRSPTATDQPVYLYKRTRWGGEKKVRRRTQASDSVPLMIEDEEEGENVF